MTDQLLLVSRIALLALVYLVFLRVARAVIVEIRAESRMVDRPVALASTSAKVPLAAAVHNVASPSSGAVETSPAGRLTVVAPTSLSGSSFVLSPETTIGRASGCGVMIDDPRISKLHARMFFNGSHWIIEDLGSTNGTTLNGGPVTSPVTVDKGGLIQVGEVVMELS